MSSNPVDDRKALLKNALVALDEMQAKLDAVERKKKEPIAIVGMSCRFPGGANDPEALWQLLINGVDAISEVPPDRWNVADYAGPDAKWYGGFLDKIDGFDPQFFGISPREVLTMDPQQRLVLEVAWEALERAGRAPDQLAGSQTGVFVGVSTTDYIQLIKQEKGNALDAYTATGTAMNSIPGRLAYTLGLNGPCMAVDTACSSALVAIHLAVQSLRNQECDMAIAGGVNAILAPENYLCCVDWGMLAPDGHCKTFDAAADGFVRSEGCGIIVLKRLSDAQAQNDNILAVISGSAVNQDGRSSGLTVPNGLAQQAVIRKALANAGRKPADVIYIETHGTGTSLGDPIEVEAIGAVMGDGRGDKPLFIGSIKTNVGHLEAASGIAGLIKVVLSMQHGQLPPHLHFSEQSPRIPWPSFPVHIPTSATDWLPGDQPRVAGVSSFGFSGTNAHVVLEDAPAKSQTISPEIERPLHVLTLSARNDKALQELAGRYAAFLTDTTSLPDAAFTANTGRALFNERAAVVVDSPASARAALAALAVGQQAPGLITGTTPNIPPKVVFLFTGQGAQYVDMGRELYETQPVFRNAINRCDELLRPYLSQSLLSVLYPEPGVQSPLDDIAFAQPAQFAIEYALAELWRSWGVTPAAVMGHSVGEYAAACIAGVFSLEDGLKLVTERGRLMQQVSNTGEMAAVFASAEQVQAVIEPYQDRVSIAAINGPETVVISGEKSAIQIIIELLAKDHIRARRLQVTTASHSPLMDPLLETFDKTARSVRYSQPRMEVVSGMTGRSIARADIATPEYWRRHLRETVRFQDAMQVLNERGYNVFIEVGAGTNLLSMGQRCLPKDENNLLWLPSIRQGQSEWGQILSSLAALFVRGARVDWNAFDRDYPRQKVIMPTYPFQRERYWISNSGDSRLPKLTFRHDAAAHPLLGPRLNVASDEEFLWENEINLSRLPFLADHRVEGAIIVPATAYMEMGVAAAIQILGQQPLAVSGVKNHKPLFFRQHDSYIVQTVLKRAADHALTFEVYSRPSQDSSLDSEWTLHMSGRIQPGGEQLLPILGNRLDVEAIMARCSQEISGEAFYGQLGKKGNQWGPSFQGVQHLWQGDGEALSLVRVPESVERDTGLYQLHPAVSDSSGHVLTATISLEKADGNKGGAFVGGGLDESRFYSHPSGKQLWCYARIRPNEGDENILIGDVAVFDEDGTLVTETVGARLWYLDRDNPEPSAMSNVDNWFYEIEWQPKESTENSVDLTGAWLILADSGGVAENLAARLESQGGQPVLVYVGDACEQISENIFRVRPEEQEDFASLLQLASWRGVIHLWSLDTAHAEDLTLSALEEARRLNLTSTLRLIQALTHSKWMQAPHLWLVTRGGQPFGQNTVQVTQSPLWGMGRSVAMEHAEFWGGLIDLDPQSSPEIAADNLTQALTQANDEDQMLIREGHFYVARLERKSLASSKTSPLMFRPDGSYLITGGLGGIGLETASWLAQKGARRLILMGRTALPPRQTWAQVEPDSRAGRQIAAIRALEAQGVSVHLAFVDVADELQLRSFLEDYEAEGWPPIRGVFHAAGVMQYQPLIEHTPEEMAHILRAKVSGGWLLHHLLRESPLDWFVMYSSASALLSSPLTASYSAANAFLDALSHERRRLGLPALSVNWGVWGEVGMVVDFGGVRMDGVMQPMPTAMCFEALERGLTTSASQVAVMAANWQRWDKLNAAFTQSRLLTHILLKPIEETILPDYEISPRQRLDSASPAEREEIVKAFLGEQVARILGFTTANLSLTQSLSVLGMDSLMAVELKNRMEMDLGVVMPLVQLLQGPTVSELSTMVLGQMPFSDSAGDVMPQGDHLEYDNAADDSWEEGEL